MQRLIIIIIIKIYLKLNLNNDFNHKKLVTIHIKMNFYQRQFN